MKIAVGILLFFIQFYMVLLLARVVIDIVSMILRDWSPRGFALVAVNIVYKATDPPLRFIGRYVPPLRLGPVAFDMAFLILILALGILGRLLQQFV